MHLVSPEEAGDLLPGSIGIVVGFSVRVLFGSSGFESKGVNCLCLIKRQGM